MVFGLRNLFRSRKPSAFQGWPEIVKWAEGRQWTFRGVRESEGFVIEGRCGTLAWRMEWGPSQRSYVDGFEWRMRAELPVPGELQALLLNRPLMVKMERAVFDQYIEGVQTQIDADIAPEMRWLVMFPKLSGAELRGLREHLAGVTNYKPWMSAWLSDALVRALQAAPAAQAAVFVMMVARGRLTVRTALAEPTVDVLESWLRFGELALREAHRAAIEDRPEASGASTQPSLWAAQHETPESEPFVIEGSSRV